MSDGPVLIVDAKNCLYRAVYAGKREAERNRGGKHHFTRMAGMIATWVRIFSPSMVVMAWDCPRSEVWRRKIHPGYKDRDNRNYIADMSRDLAETQTVAMELFKYMNVYQLFRRRMEADDLIYATCRLLRPRRTIVSSTDSDMTQIPFSMDNVSVYNVEKGRELERPQCDPVMIKALAGDDSDRIGGYSGIGPVKSARLGSDMTALAEHLSTNGKSLYIRNMMLVDLGLCPYLADNLLYVQRTLAVKPTFDQKSLMEAAQRHKVLGFMAEFSEVAIPFNSISG